MNDELILEQKFGKQNPFRVPDGYFNDFEKKLLTNMPVSAPKEKSLSRRAKLWVIAVVSTAAVTFGVVFHVSKPAALDENNAHATGYATAAAHDNIDYIIDEVSDYAMLDNGDFYSYIAGE